MKLKENAVPITCPYCNKNIDLYVNVDTTNRDKTQVNESNVLNYKQLHKYFSLYKSTSKAVKELRNRGIVIGQKGLFEYLRKNRYLSTDDMSYNYPTHKASSKGWIVAVWSSRSIEPEKKRFFTPHLSPGFIDLIEKDIKEKFCEKEYK